LKAGSSRDKRVYLLVAAGLAVILVLVVLVAGPPGRAVDWAIRAAALLGYLAALAASLSSAFMRQMLHLFGMPFLKVHHYMSIAALVLLTVHPLLVMLDMGSPAVLIPVLSSVSGFLQMGGRPAWYLLVVAALAALLRGRLGRGWRALHWLTYVALLLGAAHAMLIGSSFRAVPARVLLVLVASLALFVFARKRLDARRRRSRAAH
jgi:sulfoxide reductase heme-binding subunit YedZ